MRDERYPRHCRRNIRRLADMLCADMDTAYRLILMTATLMDLNTGDDKVIDMILTDCKAEVVNNERLSESIL